MTEDDYDYEAGLLTAVCPSWRMADFEERMEVE